MTPEIALAASARDWPDRLHRHLLDHGGARVAVRIMGPDQAANDRYDVLLIDDVSSFLTPRLVEVVRRAGCAVVGVFDPSDGHDAKRRLLDCGISDVVESDATADEFLQIVRSAVQHRSESKPDANDSESGAWLIGVTGAIEGVGATEVSVALARSLSSNLQTVLVDLDPIWPSIAPRLDLPLHPNLRTAVDRVLHDSARVSSVIHELGPLSVVGGLADHGSAGPISHTEIVMLLDVVGSMAEVVVADLGSLSNAYGPIISRFGSVALVGTGDPVGITRLLRSVDRAGALVDEDRLVVVVNKTLGSRYHESEVRAEIASADPGLPVVLLPFDRRVSEAMWEGALANRGRFARSVKRMSHLIEESVDK